MSDTTQEDWARPRAAYVHIPFCISKCHYCDFNSYPGMEAMFDRYVEALRVEISREEGGTLDSVYFGGGTPTLLPAEHLESILAAFHDRFQIAEDCEITLEANPGTVDYAKLTKLRRRGFNRLSLGVQSFDDDFLRRLGRAHTAEEALLAYAAAGDAGFDNVGIDLIFALPGQSEEHWRITLEKAVALRPKHVSAYELSIEEGTHFAELCASGELTIPNEDARVAMFELCMDILGEAGYEHYEVSNYALPGYRSRHNQVYWRNEPYYAFGAGVTSYVGGLRARRLANPREYLDAIMANKDAIEFSERLTGQERLGETIAMGLRMLDGIDLAEFESRTGVDILAEFAAEVADLSNRGMVVIEQGKMKVTRQGLMLLNDVAAEFVAGGQSSLSLNPQL